MACQPCQPPGGACIRALGSRLKVQGRHEVAPAGDIEIVNQMMIALGRHTFHRAAYDKPQKKNLRPGVDDES